MTYKISIIAACLALLVSLTVPAMAADVAQGKCVSYNVDKKVVTIEELSTKVTAEQKFGTPTGKTLEFDCSNALIGADPKPGDVLRIAYEEKSGKKSAVRVMNVTRQDIMKK